MGNFVRIIVNVHVFRKHLALNGMQIQDPDIGDLGQCLVCRFKLLANGLQKFVR